MAGPIGTPMVTPLPVAGVTAGPAWASMLLARFVEVQAYLEAKLTNASLNLSADADVLHGPRTVEYGAALAHPVGATFQAGALQYMLAAGAADTVTQAFPRAVNDRITAVSVTGRANGVTAWSWKLFSVNMSTGVVTQVGTTQTSAITAAISTLPITLLTSTIGASTYLVAEWTSGAAANRYLGSELIFDKVVAP